MGFNFRKIAAIGTSVLLAGMTMGFAAAANYPAPFVQNGAANVAIVVGSSALPADSVTAGNIVTNLNSSLSSSTSSGGSVSTSGEVVALDKGTSSRIWLNTSLTNAQTVFTKTDFPTLLADGTLSGSSTATVSQTITLGAGTADGGANSGRVIFASQPSSNTDPSVGVSIGNPQSNPLYNISVTFSTPVNFTSSLTQGQSFTMFGKPFIVSSSSSTANGIVLYSSASTLNMNQGDTKTVTVSGTSYTITLGAVSSTSAQVTVNSVQQNVNTGTTVSIGGLNVGVTSLYPSSGVAAASDRKSTRSNQINIVNASAVTLGSSKQVLSGTYATLTGAITAVTGINIAVGYTDTSHDAILKGQSFADPVFGSFQITNAGLSSSVNDTTRDTVKVGTSGATTMTLTMTDHNGNSGAFDFATNKSGFWNLTTSTGYPILPYEMANLSLNSETLVGTGSNNQNNGHLLQLQTVYNDSSSATSSYVTFLDLLSGTTYTATGSSTYGTATLPLDGLSYTVNYGTGSASGSPQTAWAQIKQSATGKFVLFPTILAKGGESVEVYAPLTTSLHNFDGSNDVSVFYLPNGNGYTTVNLAYSAASNATASYWNITGAGTGTLTSGTTGAALSNVTLTVGQLSYVLAGTATVNQTTVYLVKPGTSTTALNEPAVVLFEGKDSSNLYQAIVVDTTNVPVGTSTSGVGVAGVYPTSTTKYGSGTAGVQLYSNSNIQQYMDGYGVLVTKDSTSSSQPIATITVPTAQAYEQLYLGSVSASVSSSGGSANIGNIIVSDSQVSSVNTKNLIVLGGSCVNSAAATLLGVPMGTCTTDWTTATSVGSGQFLVQSFSSSSQNLTSGIAVLVAGYDAPDTLAAATWLTTSKTNGVGVDLSPGKKYTGTTTTGQATLVS
ncbi:MAG: hypothetical protein M1165_02440 [Candidatus Pacearchaeota archaeon]|nr:hypothetical protein [Candidatus Pacearchaeota archaeon]